MAGKVLGFVPEAVGRRVIVEGLCGPEKINLMRFCGRAPMLGDYVILDPGGMARAVEAREFERDHIRIEEVEDT